MQAVFKLAMLHLQVPSRPFYLPTPMQYAMPWPYSVVKSCCCQSVYAFTSRIIIFYLATTFFMPKVVLYKIIYIKDSV